MTKRRRFKQTTSLTNRLTSWSEAIRKEAAKLAPGPKRDLLLQRARQADTAVDIEDWVNSPGLQPPK